VRPVAPALVAELLEFEAIRCLFLVLRSHIVAVLALCALKNDVVSRHNPSLVETRIIAAPDRLIELAVTIR
jgi:hypothetical protein